MFTSKHINVTEIYLSCGSWNAHCSLAKVEIISLAFKRLIILRPAIKMHPQTHQVLESAFAAS